MDQTRKNQADEHGRGHLMDEPDIGSGEKTPGELETEEHIRQIAPPPPPGQDKPPAPRPG